jgi:putative DNA primase/helicase
MNAMEPYNVLEDDFSDLTAEFMPGTDIRPRSPEWHWRRRIVLNDFNVLAGVQGTGKSQVAVAWVAEATQQKQTVLIISGEDDPETTIKPRLIAAGADPECYWVAKQDIDFSLTRPDKLRTIIRQFGAQVVVIDPLIQYVPASADSYKDQHVRGVLGPIRAIAQQEKATVIGVMHLKKGLEREAVNAIGGSIAWTAAPRSVLLLTRHEDRQTYPDRRVLFHPKCNVGREQPPLEFDIVEVGYGEQGPFETSFVQWLGEAQHDLGEAMGNGAGAPKKVDKAQEWLRKMLAGAPVPATVLEQAATDHGISDRTLRRARKALGVLAKHVVDDDGPRWELTLPD